MHQESAAKKFCGQNGSDEKNLLLTNKVVFQLNDMQASPTFATDIFAKQRNATTGFLLKKKRQNKNKS